jgi:predicted enzyme related to lactoylglutathione lyase
MNRVIHFDIYADDPERAVKFYGKVFGWEASKWGGPRSTGW